MKGTQLVLHKRETERQKNRKTAIQRDRETERQRDREQGDREIK